MLGRVDNPSRVLVFGSDDSGCIDVSPDFISKVTDAVIDEVLEWLHKTMLNAFYRIVFRQKIYDSIATLQTDLDV